jgi:YVTN family beta-propeller protein
VRGLFVLSILCCIVSPLPAQYVESTIALPDSTYGLRGVSSLVFHSPNNMMYTAGDDSFLIAVNALTNAKLKRLAVGEGPHRLCSDPPGNKVYCTNGDATVTVIDGATNQPAGTIRVERIVTDLFYNGQEDKLYCGNTSDSFIRVIDCAGDSVVARVPVSLGPSALCYNPQLNRICCACSARDEVTVIDCAADTVVRTIWVRGVEPRDICYDSATSCVYTANTYSNTVSVIDCAGDTLVRLVPVGRWPVFITTGPPGKVYCANYEDSTVSVISVGGVQTVRAGHCPSALGFDPVNNKVYSAGYSPSSVAVIDALRDTVLTLLGTGVSPNAVCYNPAGNNTYVTSQWTDTVYVIGGASDTVDAMITFVICRPGPLCYNTTNNHLYCLDSYGGLLFIIDGASSSVLRTINTGGHPGNLVWSPASNRVYFSNADALSILDCSTDSIVAAVELVDASPFAACCSEAGDVYLASLDDGNVTVIDGSGDSVRAVIPISGYPWTLCYDQTDEKLYVGQFSANNLSVIDGTGDSLLRTISLPPLSQTVLCWNEKHDDLYVGGYGYDSLVLIDCTSDKIIRKTYVETALYGLYSDSVSDKIYGVGDYYCLSIVRAATGEFHKKLTVGNVTALLDNGKSGPANRLYCVPGVNVVGTYKIDTVLRRIPVEVEPTALAWNPTYSRMYVSNAGSSSISVIRDTFVVGMEEGQIQAASHKLQATVVRSVLFLNELGTRSGLSDNPVMSRALLLDISGRRVLELKAGANDVRALAPGVYFVRSEPSAVSKIVIAR